MDVSEQSSRVGSREASESLCRESSFSHSMDVSGTSRKGRVRFSFTLKEFKHFLALGDAINQVLHIRFGALGEYASLLPPSISGNLSLFGLQIFPHSGNLSLFGLQNFPHITILINFPHYYSYFCFPHYCYSTHGESRSPTRPICWFWESLIQKANLSLFRGKINHTISILD